MICLATPRLLLRMWLDSDLEPFTSMCADPAVMRFLGDGQPKGADEARRSFEEFRDDWDREGHGLFALERLDDGRFIGFAGVRAPTFLPEILPTLEVGWRLRSDQWGQGFATEAAAAVVDWTFGTLDVDELVSIVATDNSASIKVAMKLGMTRGRRTIVPATGRWVDVFGIDAATWRTDDGAALRAAPTDP